MPSSSRALFSRGGWLAHQEGQCVGGAALALAVAAVEADLVWLTLPDAPDDLRDALLRTVRVNAQAMGASSMLCYLSEGDHANLVFLDACGAVTVPGYMRWVAELRHQIDTELPDDLVIRAVDDVELLLSVTRLAWGGLPGHKPATAESTRVARPARAEIGVVHQWPSWPINFMPMRIPRSASSFLTTVLRLFQVIPQSLSGQRFIGETRADV